MKIAEAQKKLGDNELMLGSSISDCAVLVSTCDNYADIWDPFFTLFNKFWPNNSYPIYVNSESLECIDDHVDLRTLKGDIGISWTRRLKNALERIDEEFIIFMLDDFFLYDYVDNQRIEECVSFMRADSKIAAIYFTCLSGQIKMEDCELTGLEKCSHYGKSKVNITLTLWRKEAFARYLDQDESAWEFEENAPLRSLDNSDTFYSFTQNTKIAIPYSFTKYGLFSGKWFKDTVSLFKEHGIEHDFSKRGFYEDFEFGIIPYVNRKIKMDSYLIASYSLRNDKPRINAKDVVSEGFFTQTYTIQKAKNIAVWYPSATLFGHVIETFKCTLIYKSGLKETLSVNDIFGQFTVYKEVLYFLKPGGLVYIFLKPQQEILSITVEGYLNKSPHVNDLAFAYNMDSKVIPMEINELIITSGLYAEHLVMQETYLSFRFNSRLCYLGCERHDNEISISDGRDRLPGRFVQKFIINKPAQSTVKWYVGGLFSGFSIEDLQIKRVYYGRASILVENQEIGGEGVLIQNNWVFMASNPHLLFPLSEDIPDEIEISGVLMAPMPRKILQIAIFGSNFPDEVADTPVIDNFEIMKNHFAFFNQNGMRLLILRTKNRIRKYRVYGILKAVVKRFVKGQ